MRYGKRLQVSTLGYPSHEEVDRHAFCIYFARPLAENEQFDLEYTICVPGEMRLIDYKSLTMSINMIRCQRGVDKLEFSIKVPIIPSNFYVTKERIGGETEVCRDIEIMQTRFDDGAMELRIEVENPKRLAYIFKYDMQIDPLHYH